MIQEIDSRDIGKLSKLRVPTFFFWNWLGRAHLVPTMSFVNEIASTASRSNLRKVSSCATISFVEVADSFQVINAFGSHQFNTNEDLRHIFPDSFHIFVQVQRLQNCAFHFWLRWQEVNISQSLPLGHQSNIVPLAWTAEALYNSWLGYRCQRVLYQCQRLQEISYMIRLNWSELVQLNDGPRQISESFNSEKQTHQTHSSLTSACRWQASKLERRQGGQISLLERGWFGSSEGQKNGKIHEIPDSSLTLHGSARTQWRNAPTQHVSWQQVLRPVTYGLSHFKFDQFDPSATWHVTKEG